MALKTIQNSKPGTLNKVPLLSKPRTYFTDADDALAIAQKLNSQSNNGFYSSLKGVVVKVLNLGENGKILYVYFDVLHYPIVNSINADNAEFYLTRVEIPNEKANEGVGTDSIVEISFQDVDYSNGTFIRRIDGSSFAETTTGNSVPVSAACTRPSTSIQDSTNNNEIALVAKGVSSGENPPSIPQPQKTDCIEYNPLDPLDQPPPGNISKYFKIKDFDRFGDVQNADPNVAANLTQLARLVLDPLQDAIGEQLIVTPNGGYNGPGVDKAFAKIGKEPRKETSQHRQGIAADILKPRKFKTYEEYTGFAFDWISNLPPEIRNQITICIYNSASNFIHFDIRGRNDGLSSVTRNGVKIRYVQQ